MATRRRRRAVTVRRRTTRANPRRRRRRSATLSARRRNPGIVRRRRSARAYNPRRRHHRRRRSNPSLGNIGAIFKQMVYGAGGAILTRTASGLAMGFVPGALTGSSFTEPVLQAVIAVTAVRMLGGRFLGKPQGDIMMLGGLISAGLNAADKFLPNIQGQLTGIIRAPVAIAPNAGAPAAALSGYGGYGNYSDVEDVPGFSGGFADVEDVDTGAFNNY